VRYGEALDPQAAGLGLFRVVGSASGRHDGAAVLSDDRATLIFNPGQPFAPGETISVTVAAWRAAGTGKRYPAVSFDFAVTPPNPAKLASTTGQIVLQHSATPGPAAVADDSSSTSTGSEPAAGGSTSSGSPAAPIRRYVTLPADFPTITVTVPASGTAPGLLFASNFGLRREATGYYLLILDNQGEPVYYQPLAANSRGLDFKVLPDGTLAYADEAANSYVIMDNTYHVIRRIRPGNGYRTLDEHDLQLLPNGHYLLLAGEARPVNLSGVVPKGRADASLTGQIVQELDRNNNVVFQWRDLDYYALMDTDQAMTDARIDFSHSNSLALDNDGNILLSTRYLDEITKIDRRSGAILWRMGGKQNQFTFITAPGVSGPPQFYQQHDARRLPNGNLTVFDNHNSHQPQNSRALEYVLDEQRKTATLVWEYSPDPHEFTLAMGDVQRLDGGNTLIGWGTNQRPVLSEVRPDGSLAFELAFGAADSTYRVFRFPWHGYPTWPPALVAQVTGSALSLTTSWNGATEVAAYRFYGGNGSKPANLVAEQPKAGFETGLTVPDAAHAYCYYQAVPIDAHGQPMQPSPVVPNPAASACLGGTATPVIP
jgi:hypothetical protein